MVGVHARGSNHTAYREAIEQEGARLTLLGQPFSWGPTQVPQELP
jgi:hypothetical protein